MQTIQIERHRDRQALANEAGLGSISWISVLAGTLAAYGLTAVLLAIAGGIAAGINGGSDFSDVSWTSLRVVSVIIVAAALVVSYVFGGYVAGRMARRSGAANGVCVFLLGVVLAVAVGIWVKEAGGGRGLASTLRDVGAPTTWHQWRGAGTIAGIIALAGMLIGAMGGSAAGERWHTRLIRRALDPSVGPEAEARSNAKHFRTGPVTATPVAEAPASPAPVAAAPVAEAPGSPARVAAAPVAEAPGSPARLAAPPMAEGPASPVPAAAAPILGAVPVATTAAADNEIGNERVGSTAATTADEAGGHNGGRWRHLLHR